MKDVEHGMSLIVKTVSRLTVGLILLFGIYIIMHGHISPGGGFAGGVIIALSFINLILAFGKDTAFRKLSYNIASIFESLGGIIFVTLAILGFCNGYFFLNFLSKGEPFRLFSSGLIPLYNLAISFKVSSGLFIIFVILILFKISKANGERTE